MALTLLREHRRSDSLLGGGQVVGATKWGKRSSSACRDEGIEASNCREQYEFTIRPERMACRGDVPQVPRRPVLGRRELARVPGRLQPGADDRVGRRRQRRTRRRRRHRRPAGTGAAARSRAGPRTGQTGTAAPRPPPTSNGAGAQVAAPAKAGTAAAESAHGEETQVLRGAAAAVVKNMNSLAADPDRDQRAGHPGEADDRQPHRHQQPPQAHPRRQDLVHPPAGLRDRAGGQDVPQHEPALRRDRRQAERRSPRRTPISAWPSTCRARTGTASSSSPPSRTARPCGSASSSPPTRTSCAAPATAS